jgi:LysM repeat protein
MRPLVVFVLGALAFAPFRFALAEAPAPVATQAAVSIAPTPAAAEAAAKAGKPISTAPVPALAKPSPVAAKPTPPKAKPAPKRDVLPPGMRWHVVQKDQKLGSIAKRYLVALPVLLEANGLERRDKLQPGMKLIIPPKGATDGQPAYAVRAKLLGLEPELGESPKVAASAKRGETLGDKELPGARKGVDARKSKEEAKNDASYRPFVMRPKKKGVLTLKYREDQWTGRLFARSGRVSSKARREIESLLAVGDGAELDVELLKLLVRVSDTFGGRPIRVVSGTRTAGAAEGSRHKEGKAFDFTIEDVPLEALRDYCKSLDGVGVGFYPKSGFIHLDVRERWTYWVDVSGRGEPAHYTSTVVKASDAPDAPEVRVR